MNYAYFYEEDQNEETRQLVLSRMREFDWNLIHISEKLKEFNLNKDDKYDDQETQSTPNHSPRQEKKQKRVILFWDNLPPLNSLNMTSEQLYPEFPKMNSGEFLIEKVDLTEEAKWEKRRLMWEYVKKKMDFELPEERSVNEDVAKCWNFFKGFNVSNVNDEVVPV